MFGAAPRSSVPQLIARRYLRSTRRDAFISFLTLTAGGGLALGVAALILALAMLTGFQGALKAEILGRTPELEVRLPPELDREAVMALRDRWAEHPEIRIAQVITHGQGWVMAEGRVRAVEIVGFDGELPVSFPGATLDRRPGVYIGERLADSWGIADGEVIEIASNRPTLTPLGPQPRVRRLPVTGRFESGRTELTERVAVPLDQAAALLGSRRYRVHLGTGDLATALDVAEELASGLPEGAEIWTWQRLNRGLFFALNLEKTITFIAVFLIVAVAALALVSDLTLIITSKRREVGILGAMGADPGMLRRVFTVLGGLLATLGVGLGGLVGVVLATLLDRYRVLRIPGQVYFLDYVPFQVRMLDLGVILSATVLIAILGAGYAARRAAALQPVEALRR